MIYKFTFPTKGRKTPSLNDYIKAERIRIGGRKGKLLTQGARMKAQWQGDICVEILNQLRGVKAKTPVKIHYHYYESDRRRDIGNIHAPFQKFCEDALQDCGIIENDNQKCVIGFTATFNVDHENPRVEVEIEEITNEKGE